MAIEVNEIFMAEEKERICGDILRALPEWFAYEAPIADYAHKSRQMPFYAAHDGDNAVGFLAVKVHNPHTAEVCVTGILKEYHRQGIGRKLMDCAVKYCAGNTIQFLTVKTVADTAKSISYAKTREFYYAMGFLPLEVFPLYWDEANPCLFMVKCINGVI